MQRAALEAQYHLSGFIKRDGKWYVAYCPSLDLTTQGRTRTEAKKNMREAAELFLLSCIERGTLDLALKELGFAHVEKHLPKLPPDAFRFQVPIVLARPAASECHV